MYSTLKVIFSKINDTCKYIPVFLSQGLLTFIYISLLSTVGENVAAQMRIKLFDSLLRQDVEFFDTHKTGELVDR